MSQGAAPYGILLLLLTALLATKVVADNPVWDLNVATLAGSSPGFEDGPATTAKFGLPNSAALMSNGNVVVGDFSNNRIRMVAPDGTVSTLAGTGAGGYLDGPGASAMLNGPAGVAVMQNGSVVVAEWSHRIRLIAPDGTVTTLAGTGVSGSTDGPGNTATFALPSGVDVLPNGSIVIAEYGSHRIRMVSPDGTVSTLTGTTQGYLDGPRATAQLNSPFNVAVMPNGSVVVAEWGHYIRLVAPDGTVTTLAGTGTAAFLDGPGATAQFSYPRAAAVLKSSHRSGYILVADQGNHKIRLIGPDGYVSTLVGSSLGSADGPRAMATFNEPTDVKELPNGTIFVVDSTNRKMRLLYFADTQCTIVANCNSHASSVSGTVQTGCSCTCSTGYTGATCDACATNYYGYPSCVPIPCTIPTNCNSHASSVSGNLVDGCSCTCSAGYTGATCDVCATNYGGPSCEPLVCTADEDCNSHATSVSGTRVSGCTCTCSTGYDGVTCEKCAANYDSYPNCSAIPCTSAADCSGHAAAVSGTLISGCTCTCATGYTGPTCDSCATHYENYPACQPIPCYVGCDCSWHASSVSGNIVAGCVCECRKGYAGAKCDQCATNFENYPSCTEVTCTNVDNCHGHADTVSGTPSTGCTCVCTSGFAGEQCNMCAAGYENYPTCSLIQCNTNTDCSGHAASVTGTVYSGCECACSTGFAGNACDRCDIHYEGYPACAPISCTSRADCNGHASYVSGTTVSGCTCTCATGFNGTTCNQCAENYESYPACSPIVCTAARNCNSHAYNASGEITACQCACFTGYAGAMCEACASNYEGYPKCLPTLCTIAADCSNYTTSVTGTHVAGCTCTCRAGYGGTKCNSCAARYDGFPTCVAIPCTKDSNCNGHAAAVSGTLVSGCTCTCATGYTGSTCSQCSAAYEGYPTCVPIACNMHNDCSDHATSVSGTMVTGCVCSCETRFAGSRCEQCATNYENYPSCVESTCNVATSCNDHATSVSGTPTTHCDCECGTGFAGSHCGMCAAGYENYPTCSMIQCNVNADCSGHAASVTGTVYTGCECTCSTGFAGMACNRCDSNYEGYPACTPIVCTNRCSCNDHAVSVNGTMVAGCVCTCATAYTGPTCERCANNFEHYPSCTAVPCNVFQHCNAHADSCSGDITTGCTCSCATGFAGTTCNACAANYGGYPNCLPIVCTAAADCSNHATEVHGTRVSGCHCRCRSGFAGTNCNRCDAKYQGYPNCQPVPCTRLANCHDHATAVTGNLVAGCRCTCAAGYAGSSCDLCATNYGGYPNCTASQCSISTHCNSHATQVSGTSVTGCRCTCASNYVGASCNACGPNYESYPTCSATPCTVARNCNDHATSVNGTLASGCTCACTFGFAGAGCQTCAAGFYNYPYCSPSASKKKVHELVAKPPMPQA